MDFRMDLCYELTLRLSERLFPGTILVEDAANYVYRCPGVEAYGMWSTWRGIIASIDNTGLVTYM